jgi:long-chain fatty acid transport protein
VGFGNVQNPSNPYGSDIEQVFMSVNLARDVTHGVSLGLAPIFAAQRVNMQGLQSFDVATQTSATGRVTNNGYDYSYGGGAKVGVLYDPVEWLTMGVSYQTRIWMGKFDRYRGLFAEQGGFDVPPTLTEGLTLRPLKGLELSTEHEQIYYSQIRSIHNDGRAGAGLLGTDGGAGFGWQNMHVWRLGTQWKALDDLTLRAGYSYNTMFTKSTQVFFNTLAPATPQHTLAFGGSYDITPSWSVSLGYVHAFSNSLQGAQQNDASQTIKLRMDQDEATIGLKFKW